MKFLKSLSFMKKNLEPAKWPVLFSLVLFYSFQSGAFVDIKNANYTKSFVDFRLPQIRSPFFIKRTYNSRSLYRGVFGYGWCSNLETRLEVLPDNTLKVVECGGGLEILYTSKRVPSRPSVIIKKIMEQMKKKKGLQRRAVSQVQRELKNSPLLQSELIRVFNLKGRVQEGQTYWAVGNPRESLRVTPTGYIRSLSDGRTQVFDKNGDIVRERFLSGSWIEIKRVHGVLERVTSSSGKVLEFKRKKNLLTVTGPDNFKMEYVIKKDNLVMATNAKAEKYRHFYDNWHNLIQTRYPDGTFESLTHDTGKDWLLSFKDRAGCLEKYEYTDKKEKSYFKTEVKKSCEKKVTHTSRYEFWNNSGASALYREKQNVNGQNKSVIYTETGLPLSVTQNGVKTDYTHYANGLLKSRSDPWKRVFFSGYKNQCKKPTQVLVKSLSLAPGRRKSGSKLQTKIDYDPKTCFLVKASQKKTGRWVSVRRDSMGQVSEMRGPGKKRILVTMTKNNKLRKLTRPGVGSVRFFYDTNGQLDVRRTLLTPATPSTGLQVVRVFEEFMDIISPTGLDKI